MSNYYSYSSPPFSKGGDLNSYSNDSFSVKMTDYKRYSME